MNWQYVAQFLAATFGVMQLIAWMFAATTAINAKVDYKTWRWILVAATSLTVVFLISGVLAAGLS